MLQIDCTTTGTPLTHYWSQCVGAGRANECLRARFQEHLRTVITHCGFRYLRFHGVFHDDMFAVRRDDEGQLIFNDQYTDELIDMLLENNIRPFVELSFFPDCLRGGDAAQFWWKGHVTPPENYVDWVRLVDHAVRHWVDRYGIEEVRAWYFEVWNEPNLSAFWDGTRSAYFALYRETSMTIKKIDPLLRVGGPATSNFVPDTRFDGEIEDVSAQMTHRVTDLNGLDWHGVWILQFLDYCKCMHLPVDFVSAHPYPTDFALDQTGRCEGRVRCADSTFHDMQWLRRVLAESPYPQAELHLTEWSSSPSPRDCTHDFLQEAAYIVRTNLQCIGLVDSLSYWTFTDVFEEGGAGDSIFHGGFGMINYQSIVKPSYHAYRMLNALGNELLYREDGIVVTRRGDHMQALLYNYVGTDSIRMSPYPSRAIAEKQSDEGQCVRSELVLTGLTPNTSFSLEILDAQHGWAYPVWKEMGCPDTPSRTQTEILKQAAYHTSKQTLTANGDGVLHMSVSLQPWAVALLEELK